MLVYRKFELKIITFLYDKIKRDTHVQKKSGPTFLDMCVSLYLIIYTLPSNLYALIITFLIIVFY